MSETNESPSEPQVQLYGDLPPIDSDEFGEFLAQWHADHNEIECVSEPNLTPLS